MRKSLVFAMVAIFLIAGIVPMASAGITSTGKLGSLLVFPKIDDHNYNNEVPGSGVSETIISIENTHSSLPVTVQCVYQWPTINATPQQTCCDLIDFTFDLTARQVIYFNTRTGGKAIDPSLANGFGDDNATLAQAGPPFPEVGNAAFRGYGEMKCWAIRQQASGNKIPISWNFLGGSATIVRVDTAGSGLARAYRSWGYAPWAFTARKRGGNDMTSGIVDDPYRLMLTGKKNGYDACPKVLETTFRASRPDVTGTWVTNPVGNVPFTDLTVVPCIQDLREPDSIRTGEDPFDPTNTLLRMSIVNSNEFQISRTTSCMHCWFEQWLSAGLRAAPYPFWIEQNDSFGIARVGTNFGRVTIEALASTSCAGSVDTGLLGVSFNQIPAFGNDNGANLAGFAFTQAMNPVFQRGRTGNDYIRWTPEFGNP